MADAEGQGTQALGLPTGIELRQLADHGEGRAAPPDGVIFLGHRGAEEGHQAVAHVFVDCSPVLLNDARKGREKLIHHLRQFARGEAFGNSGEPANIREQDRHVPCVTVQ